ncbi:MULTISPECIES: methionine--tRNA ligase [unclassified Imperialibacter]|uniref:methionine--tRNA ligase n=1 Tax=unclassified Imperialibacter TaxID=2629706 RepID=UPI00125A702D|nr:MULTISPECIES: methionine--tRNA ligase [unclassified Imperialibacter]CAD5249178.1 Methionine--tRNA ligase [Imperialibacter sp. 89]CAD5264155.1 Methionine--tRNA ligase [Imperialibacter sp. 75]VVT07118.1 Methionine--tRNA ligase [Imperialibacter sp. EC-SDR9]
MAKKTYKRHTVTAALIYANGPIHIGHLAGCYLPSDIYVRYMRSMGEDIVFVSGTDEHGVPITLKARNEGTTPQAVVDKYYDIIKNSFAEFGISFDTYSRTSREIHHKTSQDFFLNLYEKGIFEEQTTEQYFDEKANQFLADRYIVGTCPTCGNENAYGDQCEKCGSTLSPQELGNPRSMLSGEKPVMKPTKNWYMPLDKLQPKIEKYVDSHPEWKTNVFGQCKSWLNQGLQPRSMTRDLDWGVKVPLPDTEGKVLYVWFDAPIGYISATKELKPDNWEKYWKDEDTRLVHFIGKDNIVFHCIIFPSMLMEHGDFVVPDNVPANEFMNLEGQKISTSRNWAVWLHEYLEEFPGKQDVLRYVLCANAPETKDNDFTWKDFQTRNNSELVAIFGNFVNRAVVLTHKYYEGKVPQRGELFQFDEETLAKLAEFPAVIAGSIEQFKFREALVSLMDLARLGNKYLADTEPWKLIKTDSERVKTIMNVALQIAATLQVVCEPFLPFTASKLGGMFNQKGVKWSDLGKGDLLAAGHQLEAATLLFEKIEDDVVEAQIAKLEATKKLNSPAEKAGEIKKAEKMEVPGLKEEIVYDDFTKLDMRVATVLECERVPKSDKLLRFLLDTGIDKRTILSGIAKHYQPEDLIGKQVVVLANLAPRKMMGIESQGMILSAEDEEGNLRLLQANAVTNPGATIS